MSVNETSFVDEDNIWSINGNINITILSLFLLWIMALTLGRIADYMRLPPLLGRRGIKIELRLGILGLGL